MKQALQAQNGLFTLVVKHGDGTYEPRVIGSIVEYLFAPDDPEAVIEKMAAESTRIVSLTITEGGYNIGVSRVSTCEPQNEVKTPVTGMPQGRQQQCRYAGVQRSAVVGGAITDHHRLRGRYLQVVQRHGEHRRIGFLDAALVRQHERGDQAIEPGPPENRAQIKMNIADHGHLQPALAERGQRGGRVVGERVVRRVRLHRVQFGGQRIVQPGGGKQLLIGRLVEGGIAVDPLELCR